MERLATQRPQQALTPYICATCGTQHAPSAVPPAQCRVCEDERQYVGWIGQAWTSLEALRASHRVRVWEEEPGLHGVGVTPSLMIGQRALLVQGASGNVLWDCLPVVDDAGLAAIAALGGVDAIAISHPHYYGVMVEWAHALGAPIYLHAADHEWVCRPDPAIRFWEGASLALGPDLTLVHCGGHFAGGAVLHWQGGAGGLGALLTGDLINVVMDRRWVSFMYSFPNLIPLSAHAVRSIAAAVSPYPFERLYAAWADKVVYRDARAAVRRSAERYLAALQAP
ncbi:MBL fold metallo-hydrolase [Deinococcus hopiensis]|uniref:Metallo-beta-lactamase superfamily protein n=1 Tax=Deinococcus hopiensis KR-140 TaxID=695939 RepID=A0A1W1VVI4_9DEIO|nr:MBL fold metallo-hydrolase [Deinococcus hopiensis]SMB96874.1 Metallo-beta-lactamase superfamily protein [Deinococcus hopiensis KR-140]